MKFTEAQKKKTARKIRDFIWDRTACYLNNDDMDYILDIIEQRGALLRKKRFQIPWDKLCGKCRTMLRDKYDKHLNEYRAKWMRKYRAKKDS